MSVVADKNAAAMGVTSLGTEGRPPLRGEVGASAPASFDYKNLRLMSRTLDDIERTRIMLGNRIDAALRADDNAIEESLPEYIRMVESALKTTEEMTVEGIEKLWSTHPLAPWAKTVRGVGPKTIGRLVAEIGDPLMRPVGHWEEGKDDKREWIVDYYVPRTLAQLRAFAGHGDPKRKYVKGMTQDEAFGLGNPLVKKRLWLIAKGGKVSTCAAHRAAKTAKAEELGVPRTQVPWFPPPLDCTCSSTHALRHVYDEARIKYATRIEETGVRAGQPWYPARQEAAALREVGKFFLRELHAEATRLAG